MNKIAIAILLSAFIAAPCIAKDMYAGVNIGSAKIDTPNYDSSTSYALLGGYNFNENVAAEIAYSYFGKEGGVGITSKSSATSISGVGSFLDFNPITLFGKLGFASSLLDLENLPSLRKRGLTYGFGAQFDVEDGSRAGFIRIGYDVYKVQDDNGVTLSQRVISVGFITRF
ncbi:MAG: outer membrane beta-barrel protein [Gallionella sp.]